MKKFCCFILLISLTFSVFALDLEAGLQWDNYGNGIGIIGFTLDIGENLSDSVKMRAVVDNLYNQNYDAFLSAKYMSKVFDIEGGVIFAFRNARVFPGMILEANLNIGHPFSVATKAKFAFCATDFAKSQIIYVKPSAIFHLKNSDVTLSYIFNYQNDIYYGLKNQHGGKLDILAFKENFPFKIDVFFEVDAEPKQDLKDYFDLDIDFGGKLIFDFGKSGCYTLKGESEIFRLSKSEEEKPPFAISATVKFKLH